MLIVKPIQITLLGAEWQAVVDETGAILGAVPTPAAANNYKSRLEKAGILSAQDMLNKIKDQHHREVMRGLMMPACMQ